MRQSGVCPAFRFRNEKVEFREALHVGFVEDCLLPGSVGLSGGSPSKRRIDHPALLYHRSAITFVEGSILVGVIEPITEKLRPPLQLADELLCIRVDDEFVWIKTMARIGLEWTVYSVAIHGS